MNRGPLGTGVAVLVALDREQAKPLLGVPAGLSGVPEVRPDGGGERLLRRPVPARLRLAVLQQ